MRPPRSCAPAAEDSAGREAITQEDAAIVAQLRAGRDAALVRRAAAVGVELVRIDEDRWRATAPGLYVVISAGQTLEHWLRRLEARP
jgi:hypothetical protein